MTASELNPLKTIDGMLLRGMREASVPVADGVLAHVQDQGSSLIVRAVLAGRPRIPGAVGRWLSSLYGERPVVVPAVVSSRLAGMLDRRGFRRQTWWDPWTNMFVDDTWIWRPRHD